MKRFIITITLLIALVGSVFAKPKKVSSFELNGYEAIEWDIGLNQKYITYDEPLQLFLVATLTDSSDYYGIVKADFEEVNQDLQELLNKYDYYMCTLDGKLITVSYKDGNTVWHIIY